MFNRYRNWPWKPKLSAKGRGGAGRRPKPGLRSTHQLPTRGIAAGRFLVPLLAESLRRPALVEVRRDVATIARNCRHSPLAAAFHGVRQTPGGDHSGVAAVGANGLELRILPVRVLQF
jgi:hypothetical protein